MKTNLFTTIVFALALNMVNAQDMGNAEYQKKGNAEYGNVGYGNGSYTVNRVNTIPTTSSSQDEMTITIKGIAASLIHQQRQFSLDRKKMEK